MQLILYKRNHWLRNFQARYVVRNHSLRYHSAKRFNAHQEDI